MESPVSNDKGDHLCVLVHGLWGNPSHLKYLASALRARYDKSILQILVVKRNAGTFTYDGIETGGERVTREIEDALEEYARNGIEIRKMSVVGYSLGGLVARYAVGLLYSKGYFEKIQPMNFCTFATPHLGVRTPLLGWHNHIWNVLGARTLSASGRQLFMIDNFRNTNRPLLSVLSDKDSVFYKGLSLFSNRVLYANAVNDRSACYYTTFISRIDPYASISSLSINYVPGYSPIVIDPNNPFSPSTKEDEKLPVSHRITKTTTGAVRRLPMVLIYSLVIPIGVIVFLLNSVIQNFSSKRRIRLHSSDESLDYHRLPLLVEEMQEAAEGIIEDIHHEMSPQHLPAGSEESVNISPTSTTSEMSRSGWTLAGSSSDFRDGGRKSQVDSDPALEDVQTISARDKNELDNENNPATASVEERTRGYEDDQAVHETEQHLPKEQSQMSFPTLALASHQFDIISSLDTMGIKKFAVYIHNDRHSHAAIIVRRPWSKRWEEGKVVVGHWLNEAFIT
ncbi:uncharacterized protein LAJ45_10031 [Morchella importuna]|uniref:uncharacterized protein n=1 Tax=Morchella importuna TaxID=1174673 RepID=UPI001E8CFBC3|nr:uncharacterized protein LAJ45_10031 [Morchella importuna]KAH8145889.1 hypothetical protein LAJ45_10031 [Morchella importuna]